MSVPIKPKRSNVAGAVPTTTNLADGEFCINTADNIIYQRVGANIVAVANFSTGGVPATDVQIFNVSDIWTKPVGAKSVLVKMMGGGGGGASGGKGATTAGRSGGVAGAGAGYSEMVIPAVAVGATEVITVGFGGAGGASRTVDGSLGAAGTSGGFSSFGSFLKTLGGTASANPIVAAAGGLGLNFSGGSSNGSGINTGQGPQNFSLLAGNAGGGGGGITTSNVASGGGTNIQSGGNVTYGSMQARSTSTAGVVGGVVNGGNGENQPTGNVAGGAGGAGGASSTTGNGGNGGNGGLYGSGGGGGGAATNGVGNSGAGGSGGSGVVVVITNF